MNVLPSANRIYWAQLRGTVGLQLMSLTKTLSPWLLSVVGRPTMTKSLDCFSHQDDFGNLQDHSFCSLSQILSTNCKHVSVLFLIFNLLYASALRPYIDRCYVCYAEAMRLKGVWGVLNDGGKTIFSTKYLHKLVRILNCPWSSFFQRTKHWGHVSSSIEVWVNLFRGLKAIQQLLITRQQRGPGVFCTVM